MEVKCDVYIQELYIYIYGYMEKTEMYNVTLSQEKKGETSLYREIIKTSNPSPGPNKRAGQHVYTEVTETSDVTLQQCTIRKNVSIQRDK
jgi:hypothetical protein